MMTNKTVIYIEDEEGPRRSYSRVLQRILGESVVVEAPELRSMLGDMLECLTQYDNVVTYVIDERLTHTGIANYSGSELVKELRNTDAKVPVYILTSFNDVDNNLGEIEFVIDKNHLNDRSFKEHVASRIKRHINVFGDILNARSSRLDELLRKLVNEGLSEVEQAEYDELNYIRTKPILLEEQAKSITLRDELDQQEALLKEIHQQLNDMDN